MPTRYQPLTYLIAYFIVTLLLFNYGPISWNANYLIVNLFLSIVWVFLIIGYYFGSWIRIPNKNPVSLNINKIIKWGVILNIITMPFAIYVYTGKLPTEISFDIALQGEAHKNFYHHIIDSQGSISRTTLSFVRAACSPLIYASIILGYKHWPELSNKNKAYVALSTLVQVAFSFSRGTDKEIADLVIFLAIAILANRRKNVLKNLSKYLVFLLILGIFASVFIERRAGRYNFELPECFSQANVCVDYDNSKISSAVGRNNYIGTAMIINYLTQGYNGMSLAMELDYKTTFGLGHSPIITRIYERLTGDSDLYTRTYNYRLRTKDWSDLYAWSSLYTWLANDVSFFGVPLAIFFIGIILGLSWRQTLLYNNDVAYMVFALCLLSLIYSPANNQLGTSLEMFSTWGFWFIFWMKKTLFK